MQSNVVIPYQDDLSSDSESGSESESDNDSSQMLSNNFGVHYNKFQTDTRFMDMENVQEYEKKRNELFTPEIVKRIITLTTSVSSKTVSLADDFKIPTKNIIGFKILKSSFLNSGAATGIAFDVSIPELPEIACTKNESGENILARVPLRQDTTHSYVHQYLELSLTNRYFYPIKLDQITIKLSVAFTGFFVFEISYLHEKNS